MPLGSSFLKSVTFVLAGRTTLSEHCPTEYIDVDYAIAERSPYLRIYLPQHVRGDRPLLPIQLGDVDPAGFKLYVEWLTTGAVDFSTQRSLPLDSCIDLIYAHVVGSMFSQPHFQDHIIDTLASILGPAQAFDQKVLELLFMEKHASSALRQFVTDKMFAHERRMLSMTRNSVENIVTAVSDVKGCEYHIHENGICYKHGAANETQGGEGEVRLVGNKWSIDDNPELNAMAAQYLGRTDATSAIEDDQSKHLLQNRNTIITSLHSSLDKRPTHKRNLVPQNRIFHSKAMHTLSLQEGDFAASSRDLQSRQPSVRSLAANVHIEKPLPPTPPTPPPRRPPSPLSLASILATQRAIQSLSSQAVHKPSAQDLVLECLGRISPAPIQRRPHQPTNEHLVQWHGNPCPPITSTNDCDIPPVVRSSNRIATPTSSPPPSSSSSSSSSSPAESSTSSGNIPHSLRPGPPPRTHPPRNLPITRLPKLETISSNSRTTTPVHKPRNTSPPPSPSPVQRPYQISPFSPSLPQFAPLIKRKPAPPRGVDWLEQWDTLFALQGTQGFGLRRGDKKERRSRFMEMLGSVKVNEKNAS